jgi:2,5-diketo-D-gluconate reductase A
MCRSKPGGTSADGKNNLFQNQVLHSNTDKHGKSIAKMVLHWLTQRRVGATPKSVRRERMAENPNIFDLELDAAKNKATATLDQKVSSLFDH